MDGLSRFLADGLQIDVRRARETISRPQHGGWYRPPIIHLLQVVDGCFRIEHPACGRRRLSAGETIIVGPGIRYFVQVDGDQAPIRYAHLDIDFFGSLPLVDVADLPVVVAGVGSQRIADAVAAVAQAQSAVDAAVLSSLAALQLGRARLLQALVDLAELHPGGARTLAGAYRLAPVLRYMRERLTADVDRRDLALIAGLSPSRFSAVFKDSLGLSPMRFLQRLRLQQARVMLADPTMQVQTVAERLHFSDAFHFSKRFKQAFGTSPTTFQRETFR